MIMVLVMDRQFMKVLVVELPAAAPADPGMDLQGLGAVALFPFVSRADRVGHGPVKFLIAILHIRHLIRGWLHELGLKFAIACLHSPLWAAAPEEKAYSMHQTSVS